MSDLSDQIEQTAGEPKRASTPDVTIEQHSLKDLVEADRYLKSQAAAGGARRGLVINKLRPPGTTS